MFDEQNKILSNIETTFKGVANRKSGLPKEYMDTILTNLEQNMTTYTVDDIDRILRYTNHMRLDDSIVQRIDEIYQKNLDLRGFDDDLRLEDIYGEPSSDGITFAGLIDTCSKVVDKANAYLINDVFNEAKYNLDAYELLKFAFYARNKLKAQSFQHYIESYLIDNRKINYRSLLIFVMMTKSKFHEIVDRGDDDYTIMVIETFRIAKQTLEAVQHMDLRFLNHANKRIYSYRKIKDDIHKETIGLILRSPRVSKDVLEQTEVEVDHRSVFQLQILNNIANVKFTGNLHAGFSKDFKYPDEIPGVRSKFDVNTGNNTISIVNNMIANNVKNMHMRNAVKTSLTRDASKRFEMLWSECKWLFSDMMKYYRKINGYTITQIANILKVSPTTISVTEKTGVELTSTWINRIQTLSKLYNVDMCYLLGCFK